MKKSIIISLAVIFLAGACTGGTTQSQEPVKQKKLTNREEAKKVGRVADKTLTRNLEKQLVGVIDSADEHNNELDSAAEEE